MSKIYKNKRFLKWQNKNRINNSVLLNAIKEMERGLIDANLGGNLFKKRIAKDGLGKRSSYRTIIAFKQSIGWTFIFGFEKNEIDNIDDNTLKAYKEYVNKILFPNFQKFLELNIVVEVPNE